jgi:hypothetical protein
MFHLENEEDNMKIIDNYRDLPIGKYLEICEIDRREDLEDINKQVSIIAILSGMDEEDIYNLPIEEYRELAIKAEFLKTPYDGEILTAKRYGLNGMVLEPVTDFRKITTAQYIDFQTFAKDVERNIVEVVSTMLIPVGKKYNQDYDVVELQNALRQHLSVADAISLFAFFFVQYTQSIKDSLTFSKEAAMKLRDPEKKKRVLKEIQKQEQHLKQIGVG